ncbi:hypothetical protein TTHERM_00581700 (macronuclear) [Tetrahymena thermophila SB210]|uniref:Uncharacterized protein n=1 Tax=Tetrahymena thermophila (strain SB210) TaxID=312017 RepID=Q23QB8_TETTS|nr:hypothetical protein TTHERM_00581700 [Tetrahymena thermophila SB210]EAR98666.1 hypothetical protein TTHERM_00581700 [Tetrahymena thermophila SB210]|eukprot:XP_001018911.1 hypothetical protein TTHERM_00581700 [Tetrahymena thermophila SB210]
MVGKQQQTDDSSMQLANKFIGQKEQLQLFKIIQKQKLSLNGMARKNSIKSLIKKAKSNKFVIKPRQKTDQHMIYLD